MVTVAPLQTITMSENTPRLLTIDELWNCWPIVPNNPSDWGKNGKFILGPKGLPVSALPTSDTTFPAQRTDYQLTKVIGLEWQHQKRRQRLNLAMVSIDSFGTPGPGLLRFSSKVAFANAWERARTEQESQVPVLEKIDAATRLKDEANKTFRNGDYMNAWFQYGNAWMQLLPYHIDTFPVGSTERNSLAKIENMILSSIMSCVLAIDKIPLLGKEHLRLVYNAGTGAGQLYIGQRIGSTVGHLQKAFKKFKEVNRRKEILHTGIVLDINEMVEQWWREIIYADFKDRMDLEQTLYDQDYKLKGPRKWIFLPRELKSRYRDEQLMVDPFA